MAYEHRRGPHRAVLFAIAEDSGRGQLDELAALARAAGLEPVGALTQKRLGPHRETYLGSGKLLELKALAISAKADVAVCDDELTPLQVRNLGDRLDLDIADRTSIILDIFAKRAHSRAGKLQVEMAQLVYRLPRLAGRGVTMSRLGGGIGTRGPGETRLELDRRTIRRRLDALRAELSELEGHRALQRVARRSRGYPLIALVGYTNAGKSSLLNALTAGGARVADELFATLDPTSRQVELADGRKAILTDTVGFISKLPTSLVGAFRATLEEAAAADLLLEVYDLASPLGLDEEATVRDVLEEIGADEVPSIRVYNKVDLYDGVARPEGIVLSARTGRGLDELRRRISEALPRGPVEVEVRIPYDRTALRSWAHRVGRVLEEAYEDEALRMRVMLSLEDADRARRELGPQALGTPSRTTEVSGRLHEPSDLRE